VYFKEQPHHPHLPAQNHAQKEYHLRESEKENLCCILCALLVYARIVLARFVPRGVPAKAD
jgi:hypothetical protein